MIKLSTVRKKALRKPEVAREYAKLTTEFEVAKALIRARQASKMTQSEVAQKMNTSQSHIARLESGNHLPSLQTIHKFALAIERKITIEIRP